MLIKFKEILFIVKVKAANHTMERKKVAIIKLSLIKKGIMIIVKS